MLHKISMPKIPIANITRFFYIQIVRYKEYEMVITATELKANIGHYLSAVSRDDVFITKNGRLIAKLSSLTQDKQALLDSLVGITSNNPVSLEEAKKERLARG